jgi:hypothetical protein
MSHLYTLLTEAAPAQLVLPNWAFPAIAVGVFLVLAFVTWSYRDVANRHSDKTGGASGHSDAGHGQH